MEKHKESLIVHELPVPVAQPSARASTRSRWIPITLIALSLASLSYQYGPSIPYSNLTRSLDRHDSAVDRYVERFSGHVRDKWGNSDSDLVKHFLSVPSAESARRVSKSFTRETHIAGTEGDRKSALRVKYQWEQLLGVPHTPENANVFDAGTPQDRRALTGKTHRCHKWARRILDRVKTLARRSRREHHIDSAAPARVWISTYYPLLNYPSNHSLTLTPRNSTTNTPSFVACLTEDVFDHEDPTSSIGVPTFHGFSKNGTAHGQLVYAGRGTREDYAKLAEEGVRVEGNIVIVQYGGSFRGLKVKAAAEAGAVACIIYSDPAADGDITVENGYEPYPQGPARAPSSVQRGSVQYLSIRPGDPLTPQVPAYNPQLANSPKRLPRSSEDLNIPTIPSIPISYQDAIPLLKSLNGRGQQRQDRAGWKEGGLRSNGVEYWTGPGDETVKLQNEMSEKITPIWNTMAIIPGVIEDEIVVIGNHNDAWTFGAGDPNSGTASMHETVKAFGQLLQRDRTWKPFRTILLASWDAEEYGLIGSTEFGEDFTEYLRERVVAYLNLDVSVSGSKFELAASPSLSDLLQRSTAIVQQDTPETIDVRNTRVKTLGSGSDFSVFLQYIGVAAGNLGFSGGPQDPVYHYHSNYDSFAWMEKFGDPTFERHVAVSKVLGLTALRLVEDLVLPLNTTAYSLELGQYLDKVTNLSSYPGREQLDVDRLRTRMNKLYETSVALDLRAEELVGRLEHLRDGSRHHAEHDLGHRHEHHHHHHDKHHDKHHHKHEHHKRKEAKKIMKEIRAINRKKQRFENTLLVPTGQDGLVGREWYRSLVVAPGRWLGYGATTLPGLTEALELDQDVVQAKKEVDRLERSIQRAIALLRI
ncbi:M28 family metallopeptidase [Sporobolomyces koalae]|uniref:M28 family metallopeptidase n=1 Tax=Sporobolomyces koalae TaxID=500713 RepID=UPI00318270A7